MEDNKKCLKYKEMIMEVIDGEADSSVMDMVKKHVKTCPDCLKYEKSLKNMVKLTSLMKVEAPVYLETRVMAAIKSESIKPSFKWVPTLSYGTAFSAALIASFFLLYNKAQVPTADLAASKPVVIAQEPAAAPVIIVKKETVKAPVVAVKPEPVKSSVQPVSAEPAIEAAAVTAIERGPVKDNTSVEKSSGQSASVPALGTNPNYGVESVELESGMRAAKVTPVPTQPGLPLLDQDKAIVANNLINTKLGQAARIVIKVEETTMVKIVIYDKTGRVVARILNEEKVPGNYEAYWYGKNDSAQTVSEGAYFVYVQIGKRVIKNHIIVNKD